MSLLTEEKLADSYIEKGKNCLEFQNIHDAQKWYIKGLYIYEEALSETPDPVPILRKMCSVSWEISALYQTLNNIDLSLVWADQNMEFCSRLYEATKDPDAYHLVAYAYMNYGDIELIQHNHDGAQPYFLKSIDIFKELADIYNNTSDTAQVVEIYRDLASVYGNLGQILRIRPDPERSMEMFMNGLEYHMLTVETTNLAQDIQKLGNHCFNMGLAQVQFDDDSGARISFINSASVYTSLADNTGITYFRQNVISAYEQIREIELRAGNTREAEIWKKRADMITENIL